MTPIRTETLALTDGTELPLTMAGPDGIVRGGLVVLHEANGVTDRVRDRVTALADEGWLVAAPHLYHRHVARNDVERTDEQVRHLSSESVLADTDAAFVWLTGQGISPDCQGVLGFEVGGAAALLVAAHRSVGAAVTVGGGGIVEPLAVELPALVTVAGELACPWLGLYGEDDGIPVEQVEKLREAADDAEVATDIVRCPETVAVGSQGEAWQRARNWLDQHLR